MSNMEDYMSKNVILVVVDQMRSDALSLNDPNRFVSTPTLDMLASQGVNFTNAYSVVPSCVPARAALLTGLKQENSGRVGYEDCVPWNYETTLAQTFKDSGYQTECIGKMHVYPSRKRLGFEHVLLHDGYLHVDRKYDQSYGQQFEYASDYLRDLKNTINHGIDLIDSGLNCNSWEARPWSLPENLHPTNWVVTEAIKFLQRRDPTVPFFLKLSFEKPHAPLDPPSYYFDMYMDRLPDEVDLHIGNWEQLEERIPGIYDLRGKLKADDQRRMLAAYLGLITHIDHQISRLLTAIKEFRLDKETVILFVSDHGDQLGEHYLFRKGYPYQGSIKIPFFIYDPTKPIEYGRTCDELVTLRDIFPTLSDMILNKDPKVDGRSILPLLNGENVTWREALHGEHSLGIDSSQFIVTKEWKFIWYPVRDEFQLFHLVNDPNEKHDLAKLSKYDTVLDMFKYKMVKFLENREEGFVRSGKLTKIDITRIRATLRNISSIGS